MWATVQHIQSSKVEHFEEMNSPEPSSTSSSKLISNADDGRIKATVIRCRSSSEIGLRNVIQQYANFPEKLIRVFSMCETRRKNKLVDNVVLFSGQIRAEQKFDRVIVFNGDMKQTQCRLRV